MPKRVPRATFEWVFPPNKCYKYFENHEQHPFLHQATSFEMRNAWWLAEAALLAYAEPGFAVSRFNSAGLKVEGDRPFSRNSTQCYVLYNDDFIIVSFRGTQVYKPGLDVSLKEIIRQIIADLAADAKLALVKFDKGAYVHKGFKQALDEVWESELKPCLDRLKNEKPARTIWLTGHSLGAALATLAAARYKDIQGLYTFGCPRVGDGGFKDRFPVKDKNYRFVNNNDIVTLVPPLARYRPFCFRMGVYRHTGELKYIDSAGNIIVDSSISERMIDSVRGSVTHFLESIRRFKEDWTVQLPDDRINDHGPIFYAVHIWNQYEKTLTGNLLRAPQP